MWVAKAKTGSSHSPGFSLHDFFPFFSPNSIWNYLQYVHVHYVFGSVRHIPCLMMYTSKTSAGLCLGTAWWLLYYSQQLKSCNRNVHLRGFSNCSSHMGNNNWGICSDILIIQLIFVLCKLLFARRARFSLMWHLDEWCCCENLSNLGLYLRTWTGRHSETLNLQLFQV